MSLEEQTKKTPLFSLKGKKYVAKCVKCYDADTIHVVFEFSGSYTRFCCRLFGIDTAEIRTRDTAEKEHAYKARDFLRELILGKLIQIHCYDFDKYGRLLIDIFPYNKDALSGGGASTSRESYNDILVEKNFAYHYDGSKKQKFNEWFDKTAA